MTDILDTVVERYLVGAQTYTHATEADRDAIYRGLACDRCGQRPHSEHEWTEQTFQRCRCATWRCSACGHVQGGMYASDCHTHGYWLDPRRSAMRAAYRHKTRGRRP